MKRFSNQTILEATRIIYVSQLILDSVLSNGEKAQLLLERMNFLHSLDDARLLAMQVDDISNT